MKKYIDAIKQYAKDATTSDAKTGACWEGYERVPNTKKGEPGSCRKIGSSEANHKYENPKTGEMFSFTRKGNYKKDGVKLVYRGKADKPSKKDPRRTPAPKKDQKKGSKKNKPDSAKNPSGKITFSKEVTQQLSNKVKEHNAKVSRHGWAIARVNAFLTLLRTGKPSNSAYTQDNDLLPKGHPKKSKGFFEGDSSWNEEWQEKTEAAEYQGRKVTLNKPFLTPDGPKKRSVYVKNEKGNVVKVNFGDPNMKIKKNDPARRKSFRARHNCDNPGPKWKARYWSCKAW